jgi:hypothetical protein
MPVKRIDDTDLHELGEAAFTAWAYSVAHGNDGAPPERDVTIDIRATLPPDAIVRHFHLDV